MVIDEAALARVGQGLVQQVVDEVNARLHGEDHPLLHQAAHQKTLQSRLVNTFHPLDNSTVCSNHSFTVTEKVIVLTIFDHSIELIFLYILDEVYCKSHIISCSVRYLQPRLTGATAKHN